MCFYSNNHLIVYSFVLRSIYRITLSTKTDKMAKLSPKIEIINHFDDLINQVDINIEQSIEKYKDDRILGEVNCFKVENRTLFEENWIDLTVNKSPQAKKCETVNEWSESTKVIDYLNQVRQRTIDELRKAQEDSLEYLKSESCDLNHIKQSKDVEEMKSRLFADKFYFQVLYEHQDCWVFNLYTIVTDFYLSSSEIRFLG